MCVLLAFIGKAAAEHEICLAKPTDILRLVQVRRILEPERGAEKKLSRGLKKNESMNDRQTRMFLCSSQC